MLELIVYISLVILGFSFGFYKGVMFTVKKVEQQLDETYAKVQQKPETTVMNVRVEQHDGMVYLYDVTDGGLKFIAQGNDKDSLLDHIKHCNFKTNTVLNITESDSDDTVVLIKSWMEVSS